MATLQNLRNKAGVLLAAVIFIALAAFILGDLLQSGNSLIRGKQMEIARIDGESIEYTEFQASFDEISKIYKTNNKVNNLDEEAYQQILNQTWESMVEQKIMGKVYEELGIDVTSEEMFDMVQGNTLHPIITQLFGDPQTRQVNKSNIIQFLKYIQENPDSPQKESWMNIEKQIIKSKKLSKYTDLVAKGQTAISLQAKQSIIEKNVTANLKFIQKKYASIPDKDIVYTNAELKKYYDDHISDFKQKNQKTLSYVSFNILPSPEDDRDAMNFINNLKSEFITEENNIRFVNANADNRFEDIYHTEKELPTAVAEWAFNTSINDVFGPIKDGDFYKLFKLNAVKMIPDSVKASHILIRVQNANEAQPANAKIDSLKKLIESGRLSFELAAISNSQDGSASQGGDLGWFKRGMMVPEFEKAAFMSEKDELVTAQTQFGVHLIKVTVQGSKSKNVQLAVIDRQVSPSTTTYQNIYSEASKFVAEAQDLQGLINAANNKKLIKKTITVNENDRTIPGLGPVRSIIRSAFVNSKVGQLVVGNDRSPIFEIEGKFIIAAVEADFKEGKKSFESVKSTIEQAVIKEKKQKMLLDNFNSAMGSDIEQTASKLNLEVGKASDFQLAFGSINAIGNDAAINGAVAKLVINKQSKPIVGRNGVYIIELTVKSGSTEGNISQEKHSLYLNSSYRANYQAFETLKKNTEITDKRWKFY